ncbi:KOW domain-containing RNA-binding protein [Desulfolucanica intricata]|uniref:KOW domain-containing RNA-binding protein n=1 Tax=Desulfolucanica intricata TaxID=1285191 RepID=UPI00082C4D42|nr:KOW domain-containing RNA-binding protein [Desulfolucanica intricata]
MKDKLKTAQLVRSTAGRDKGKYYLVLDAINESMVLVVNGVERRIDCPKKKNVKHLKVFSIVAENIRKKILSGKQITNLDVSRAIDNLINNS